MKCFIFYLFFCLIYLKTGSSILNEQQLSTKYPSSLAIGRQFFSPTQLVGSQKLTLAQLSTFNQRPPSIVFTRRETKREHIASDGPGDYLVIN